MGGPQPAITVLAFMVGAALVHPDHRRPRGISAGAWLGGGQARAVGAQASGGTWVFGAGGEGSYSLEGGSLDAELLCRLPGTQPRVTRQTSPD